MTVGELRSALEGMADAILIVVDDYQGNIIPATMACECKDGVPGVAIGFDDSKGQFLYIAGE